MPPTWKARCRFTARRAAARSSSTRTGMNGATVNDERPSGAGEPLVDEDPVAMQLVLAVQEQEPAVGHLRGLADPGRRERTMEDRDRLARAGEAQEEARRDLHELARVAVPIAADERAHRLG